MPVLTSRRPSRVETVAEHLKQRGHISPGSAIVEYGQFRLSDVIHRLRNDRADLVPPGKEIVTVHKVDTKGAPYGEYHLVETRAAATRRRLETVRRHFDTTESRLAYRDELSVLRGTHPVGG